MLIRNQQCRRRARRWPTMAVSAIAATSMAAACALFEVPDPAPPMPSAPDRPGLEGVDAIPMPEAKASPAAPTPSDDSRQLVLGQWRQGWLHCQAKKCNDAYRLEVPEAGVLRLDLRAPGDDGLPDLGLTVEDLGGHLIGASVRPLERPRVIHKKVKRGHYQVDVYALGVNGEMVSYDLVAKLEKKKPKPRRSRRKPAPPRPQFQIVKSEILEVEREGGEPSFVLIEAGQNQQIQPGFGGQLVEDGRRIAEIEVVEVFPDGSRVRIVDRLSAPITIETTAEIRVPRTH